jgi:drug/metabolite transporter (DMT)-like permease
MMNFALYLGTVLIWGTTWFAIKLQLGVVSPEASILYRSILAATLLFGWCVLRRLPLRLSAREHAFVALFGILQFGANFLLLYHGSKHLPSGVVSVVFSTIVVWNILSGVLLFNRSVDARMMVGAAIGLMGIAATFWKDISTFNLSFGGSLGLLLSLGGTLCASLGNMTSARNQKAGIPVLLANAYGTVYAAVFVAIYIWLVGAPLEFEVSATYIGALLYLALFGSVLGFGFYLTLLGRIGPERAAYSSVLYPVVALSISMTIEGYAWTSQLISGALLILLGNCVVLLKFRRSSIPVLARKSTKE